MEQDICRPTSSFYLLSTSNGTVVYGVEDGDDTSYEDILFCIDANPNEAIQDSGPSGHRPGRATVTSPKQPTARMPTKTSGPMAVTMT